MRKREQSRIIRNLELDKQGRLVSLILFRFVMVTVLLLVSLLLHSGKQGNMFALVEVRVLFAVVVGSYLLSLAYLLAVKYNANYNVHSLTQLSTDMITWSILVYITGGIHSPFTFLYTISLISGAVLLGRGGMIYTFITSSLLLFIIIVLQGTEVGASMIGQPKTTITPITLYTGYLYGLNLSMFGLIGYWAYSLSERIESTRAELAAQHRSYMQLKTLYWNILESMNSALVVVDSSGTVRVWNRAAEMLTGIPSAKALGKGIDMVLPPLSKLLLRKNIKLPAELPMLNRNGQKIIVMIWISDYLDDMGKVAGKMILLEDITQVRRLESQLKTKERLAALGKLTAGVAHEIRNPLTSISGSAQMLAMRTTDERDKRLINIIEEESKRLNRLISDFLNYAKPPTLNMERHSFAELVADILSLIPEHAKEKHIDVVFEENEALKMPVRMDLDITKQVVWNVLLNAIDAMPDDGGEIQIFGELGDSDNGREVRLVIRDNGSGIPEDVLAHIFDPFFTTKKTGTGLGMTIAYQLIQAQGGDVSVESAVDVGTTVRIHLPYEEEPEAENSDEEVNDGEQ